MSKSYRFMLFVGIVIPFLGFVAGIGFTLRNGFDLFLISLSVCMLVGRFVPTGLGTTIGYHRRLAHQSFETYAAVDFVLTVLAVWGLGVGPSGFVRNHRPHHKESDRAKDLHSPWKYGKSPRGMIKGFIYSHLGWLFMNSEVSLFPRDILRNKAVMFVDRTVPIWIALGLAIPTLIGALIGSFFERTWESAIIGFLWGGLSGIFVCHHAIWSTNSICHMIGSKPFRTPTADESRNVFLLFFALLGENWHRNHHAFQRSARHGLYWWQIDFSWYVIWIMKKLRLVWNVRVPSRSEIEAQLLRPQTQNV